MDVNIIKAVAGILGGGILLAGIVLLRRWLRDTLKDRAAERQAMWKFLNNHVTTNTRAVEKSTQMTEQQIEVLRGLTDVVRECPKKEG